MDLDALASLTSTRQGRPPSSRSRLQRLTDETLGFLSAAAVWGRHASVDGERRARGDRRGARPHDGGGGPTGRFDLDLRARDGFSFIHDMVREGALQRLDDEERRSLHRRAAELIERTRPADVFDLAYHFDRVGRTRAGGRGRARSRVLARSRQALESAETMLQIAARGATEADPATRRPRRRGARRRS